MTVFNKTSKVQKEIGVLSKDADNPFYKSKYLTLDKIVSNLQPLLEKHKLFLTQMPQNEVLTTLVVDLEDESKLEANCRLECPPHDPQKQGSAITYARRYSLGCIFQIQTEEDDDGNKTVVKPPTPYSRHVECEPDAMEQEIMKRPCKVCGGQIKWSTKKCKTYCPTCVKAYYASKEGK